MQTSSVIRTQSKIPMGLEGTWRIIGSSTHEWRKDQRKSWWYISEEKCTSNFFSKVIPSLGRMLETFSHEEIFHGARGNKRIQLSSTKHFGWVGQDKVDTILIVWQRPQESKAHTRLPYSLERKLSCQRDWVLQELCFLGSHTPSRSALHIIL